MPGCVSFILFIVLSSLLKAQNSWADPEKKSSASITHAKTAGTGKTAKIRKEISRRSGLLRFL